MSSSDDSDEEETDEETININILGGAQQRQAPAESSESEEEDTDPSEDEQEQSLPPSDGLGSLSEEEEDTMSSEASEAASDGAEAMQTQSSEFLESSIPPESEPPPPSSSATATTESASEEEEAPEFASDGAEAEQPQVVSEAKESESPVSSAGPETASEDDEDDGDFKHVIKAEHFPPGVMPYQTILTKNLLAGVGVQKTKPMDMTDGEYIDRVIDPALRPLVDDLSKRMPTNPMAYIRMWLDNPPPLNVTMYERRRYYDSTIAPIIHSIVEEALMRRPPDFLRWLRDLMKTTVLKGNRHIGATSDGQIPLAYRDYVASDETMLQLLKAAINNPDPPKIGNSLHTKINDIIQQSGGGDLSEVLQKKIAMQDNFLVNAANSGSAGGDKQAVAQALIGLANSLMGGGGSGQETIAPGSPAFGPLGFNVGGVPDGALRQPIGGMNYAAGQRPTNSGGVGFNAHALHNVNLEAGPGLSADKIGPLHQSTGQTIARVMTNNARARHEGETNLTGQIAPIPTERGGWDNEVEDTMRREWKTEADEIFRLHFDHSADTKELGALQGEQLQKIEHEMQGEGSAAGSGGGGSIESGNEDEQAGGGGASASGAKNKKGGSDGSAAAAPPARANPYSFYADLHDADMEEEGWLTGEQAFGSSSKSKSANTRKNKNDREAGRASSPSSKKNKKASASESKGEAKARGRDSSIEKKSKKEKGSSRKEDKRASDRETVNLESSRSRRATSRTTTSPILKDTSSSSRSSLLRAHDSPKRSVTFSPDVLRDNVDVYPARDADLYRGLKYDYSKATRDRDRDPLTTTTGRQSNYRRGAARPTSPRTTSARSAGGHDFEPRTKLAEDIIKAARATRVVDRTSPRRRAVGEGGTTTTATSDEQYRSFAREGAHTRSAGASSSSSSIAGKTSSASRTRHRIDLSKVSHGEREQGASSPSSSRALQELDAEFAELQGGRGHKNQKSAGASGLDLNSRTTSRDPSARTLDFDSTSVYSDDSKGSSSTSSSVRPDGVVRVRTRPRAGAADLGDHTVRSSRELLKERKKTRTAAATSSSSHQLVSSTARITSSSKTKTTSSSSMAMTKIDKNSAPVTGGYLIRVTRQHLEEAASNPIVDANVGSLMSLMKEAGFYEAWRKSGDKLPPIGDVLCTVSLPTSASGELPEASDDERFARLVRTKALLVMPVGRKAVIPPHELLSHSVKAIALFLRRVLRNFQTLSRIEVLDPGVQLAEMYSTSASSRRKSRQEGSSGSSLSKLQQEVTSTCDTPSSVVDMRLARAGSVVGRRLRMLGILEESLASSIVSDSPSDERDAASWRLAFAEKGGEVVDIIGAKE
ncbi:unnamed protein product [Amoebophrya sp. A25]|nr:unnamed protein product [Amoebophrya sp. A25]|eukprot:GSA25T00002518001.1